MINPDRERAHACLELAKVWRARCRFLERRLASLEERMTADPTDLSDSLAAELQKLRRFTDSALSDEPLTSAVPDATT